MTKIEFVKKAVSTVVGFGTAKIVRDIIKNNVDCDTTTSKVTVTTASAAIGGAVAEITSEYTDHQIDEIAALWRKIKDRKAK